MNSSKNSDLARKPKHSFIVVLNGVSTYSAHPILKGGLGMRNIVTLLIVLLSTGCGSTVRYVPGPQGPEGPQGPQGPQGEQAEEDESWTGYYSIGGQSISLVEDEDGFIDVAGYVYAENPDDGTDGEFYLTIAAQRIIDGKIRYERIVTSAQFNTYLFNVERDTGQDLADENHYFTYTMYFEDDKLTIELVVRDLDFETVVDRKITEE